KQVPYEGLPGVGETVNHDHVFAHATTIVSSVIGVSGTDRVFIRAKATVVGQTDANGAASFFSQGEMDPAKFADPRCIVDGHIERSKLSVTALAAESQITIAKAGFLRIVDVGELALTFGELRGEVGFVFEDSQDRRTPW